MSIHVTLFFKFKSTDVNLLSSLVCLSEKMADSVLWLVRSPDNKTSGKVSVRVGVRLFRKASFLEQDCRHPSTYIVKSNHKGWLFYCSRIPFTILIKWKRKSFSTVISSVLRCSELGHHSSAILLVRWWDTHTGPASVLSSSQWDPFRSSSPLLLLSSRQTSRTETSLQRFCGAVCGHPVPAIYQVGVEITAGVVIT